MKLKTCLLFVAIFLGTFFGNAQIESDVYQFPKIKSHVTLPISISVQEINTLLNNSVKGTIYEDNSYTDNGNDQFRVKVEKQGEIKLIALKENRFLIEVPLKIWAEKGYGGFGKYIYQDTDFTVVMKFITAVDLKSDWTLSTQTKTSGFEWKVKPVLNYGKVQIPIASLIESTLRDQQAKFTTVIDQKIKESFDLKPYLLKVWNNFNTPLHISPEYATWLKITPQTVYMTPIKIYADYIKGTVGVDLYSETYIGEELTKNPLLTHFPNFQLKQELPSEFLLKNTTNISFDKMNELAKKQFVGYEFELNKKKNKVRVTDIRIYPKDKSIVLEIDTEGEIKGTSIIKGVPYYDGINPRIALCEVDFRFKTRNVFKKAIALLFEKKITRMIENEYGVPMKSIIQMSRQNLHESLNKEYYPGIFLNGTVLDFTPSEVLIFEQFMTLVIDTKAQLKLEVRGLSF